MASRILIDTQALSWFAEDSPSLSSHALSLVDDRSTVRLASAASLWEMAIKIAIGKLTLKAGTLRDFARLLTANDIRAMPVFGEDAMEGAALPVGPHPVRPAHRRAVLAVRPHAHLHRRRVRRLRRAARAVGEQCRAPSSPPPH